MNSGRWTALFRRHTASGRCGNGSRRRTLAAMLRSGAWLILLLAGGSAWADDTVEVAIGYSGPLSGMPELYGRSLADAAQLAVDEANRRNVRLQGKRAVFKLLVQDDKHNPNTAVAVANYFIKSDVVGVIGNTSTTVSLATEGSYEAAMLAHISPASTGRSLTRQGHRSVFRVVGHDGAAVDYLSRYLVENMKVKRIAVIDNGTPFGAGLADSFITSFGKAGGIVAGRFSVTGRTYDFNAALEQVRAAKPELIFWGGNAEQAAMLTSSVVRLNIGAKVVSSQIGAASLAFLETAGYAAEGTIMLESGLPPERMAGWKRFENAYNKQSSVPINPFTVFAYDAANALIAAVEQAKSTNRKAVIDSLHALRYQGVTGLISFDASGDVVHPAFTILRAERDKWRVINTSAEK